MSTRLSRPLLEICVLVGTTVLAVATYLGFDHLYAAQILPDYDYYGFERRLLEAPDLAMLFGFYLAPLLFMPRVLRRPSDVAVWFLYLFAYLPVVLMGVHYFESGRAEVLGLYSTTLLGMFVLWISRLHGVSLGLNSRLPRRASIRWFVVTGAVAFVMLLVVVVGVDLPAGLEDAYARRESAQSADGRLFSYVLAQGSAVVFVLGSYLAVFRRSWIWLALVLATAMLNFAHDGTKLSLVLPAMLIALAMLLRHSRLLLVLFALPLAAMCAAIVEIELLGSHSISELLIRRSFAVPGYLSSCYYEFFSGHDPVLLTDSVGRILADPVYPVPVSYLMGEHCYPDLGINANTNLWLGGFAQFGTAGVVVFSALAGWTLGIVDNLCARGFFALGCIACAFLGILWAEQFFHTSLLSGGVLGLLLTLYLIAHSAGLSSRWSAGGGIPGRS